MSTGAFSFFHQVVSPTAQKANKKLSSFLSKNVDCRTAPTFAISHICVTGVVKKKENQRESSTRSYIVFLCYDKHPFVHSETTKTKRTRCTNSYVVGDKLNKRKHFSIASLLQRVT